MGVKAYNGRLLVDEFDFSTDTFAASLAVTAEPLESSNWQSTAMQYQPDAASGQLSMTGYYTGNDAGDIFAEIYGRLGTETDAWIGWLLNTTAVGQPAYVVDTAWGSNVTVNTPVNELLKFDGQFEGVIYGGLTQALEALPEYHPPEAMKALFRGALRREGEVAVHFAAMLYYLHGKAKVPFDWDHRPFFLKFHAPVGPEREALFRELCERIGVDPVPYLTAR